ncbi:protein of unknown function [Marininema mesophilum]|uniref:DUF1540 domain-containing protein n=1 Tax=Marininema mesophilum TaxID=1048340 RepID=A0A1H2S3W4_9BACL|nr:DUF1540 domain-containing protein [Marininema mesophilum]SDW26301.1 protein of unknown function [Marininema mesophilum]
MPKGVQCEVDTCTYWAEGNNCDATQIMVVGHTQKPHDSEETDCDTFESKH